MSEGKKHYWKDGCFTMCGLPIAVGKDNPRYTRLLPWVTCRKCLKANASRKTEAANAQAK